MFHSDALNLPLRLGKNLDSTWTKKFKGFLGDFFMAWKKTKYPGVRYREHPSRKHGIRPDQYFTISSWVDGKTVEEGLGWASEGWTPKQAAALRSELAQNRRRGNGPRTLKEARLFQERVQAAQTAHGLTVTEFWEQDYFHVLKARVKPCSWQKELSLFKLWAEPVFGSKSLAELKPEDIEQALDRMRAEGKSPRWQEYFRGTVFRIWKHAGRRKLVRAGDNPAAGLKLERVNNTRLRVLTPKELKDILNYLEISDPAAADLTLFCAFTGCRFSEAARLTWEFLDFERSAALFPETKNRDSREVFLVLSILDMLKNRKPGGPGQFVFTRRNGSPWPCPPAAFKTAVKNLGLNEGRGPRDKTTFHSLRHSAATYAARRGTPVKDLQSIFGWRTPSMVFRYAKGDISAQRQAMGGIWTALTGEPAKVLPLARVNRA